MVLHKAPIPASKVLRKGKEEDALRKEVKAQAKADTSAASDFSASSGGVGKMISVANPMNLGGAAVGAVTGSRNKYKAHKTSPLYFPGAKSAALRAHSGVKFKVYRIDSPDDISDPVVIVFKVDLANKVIRTNNPAAASQKLSRKYYPLQGLDIELWDHDDKWDGGHVWGISLVERQTTCFCMVAGVERDYIFPNKGDRDRFCTIIHAVDDGVFTEEQQAMFDMSELDMTPKAPPDPLKLFVTTWNMGNAPWSTNLGDWIPNDGSMDIVVVGTQESLLGGDTTGMTSGASNKWFKALETHLGSDYVTVATRNMFQNFLCVLTKREHANAFTGVETYQAEQGIGSIWGNKGGTAVALRFNGYRLAFLNTHLAAHAEKVEKRKEDIKAIIRDIHFGSYSKVEFVTQYTTFWLGDLNFRVDMPMEEANKAIDAGDMAPLLEKEQLTNEMNAGLLSSFVEGELSFRPTYKFDVGTSVPTAPRPFSGYKERTPSWTDRVLVSKMPGHSLELEKYDSTFKVVSSDHEPVFAIYNFDAPPIPEGGNYRRFLLIIKDLKVTGLENPDANVMMTINFPFLDDIKKGVKFKHTIPLQPDPRNPGTYVNGSTFKLGPFITTEDYFRRRHIILRVKDKADRHGTGAASLKESVDCFQGGQPKDFESNITKRSYCRGTITGSIAVKIAGGQEMGMSLMENSTDFEDRKAAGKLEEHEDSDSDHEIDEEVIEELVAEGQMMLTSDTGAEPDIEAGDDALDQQGLD